MSKLISARVRVSYGGHGVVRTETGEQLHAKFRRAVGRPVCGDQVLVETTRDGECAVNRILPRDNEFARADAKGRKHIIAANLDQVLIVIAPSPAPSKDLLDRYLVAVHSLGIEPAIVFNKIDLLEAGTPETLEHIEDYRALGYPLVRTSCQSQTGLDALRQQAVDCTSILVGQSGVGKSSLIRQLLPDLDIQVGELSSVTGKGTHTTTTTTIYDLEPAGHLVDSPGVWEFGLWKLDPLELAAGYPEFRPWLGECRFNNCLHDSEPGCAVKAAVERGEISGRRHQAYLRLQAQNRQSP